MCADDWQVMSSDERKEGRSEKKHGRVEDKEGIDDTVM